MIRFLSGFIAAVLLLAIGAFVAVKFGLVPARADTPPMPMEKWAAHTSLDATIEREQPQPPYPYGPPTDATIAAGAKLYMANCAVCHGSPGKAETAIAKGLYVAAPQFTKHGVSDDPAGETYWKIEHGIRFTGMPAFVGSLSEEQIWQIAYFLSHGMDKLPPAADAIWTGANGS